MWAILYFLFNFNIFDGHMWQRLMRARLHGFAGFVFGIMILSALPLYIASTVLIVRKKQPLFTVPFPKINLGKLLRTTDTTPTTTEPEPESTTPDSSIIKPIEIELSPEIPAELRQAFRRIHCLEKAYPKPTPNNTNNNPTFIQGAPTGQTDISPDDFPLPTDFDISSSFDDSAPTFTDISFDTPTETDDTLPAPEMSGPDFADTISKLTQRLTESGQDFTIVDADSIVLTNTHAIACHTDPDFWVTDKDTWFAAGKSCTSPIVTAQTYAEQHNIKPAIYLGATNILDLDKLVPEWESAGITVIMDTE